MVYFYTLLIVLKNATIKEKHATWLKGTFNRNKQINDIIINTSACN